MPRALAFFVFFAIFSSVMGLAHYYVWLRMVRDPGWPPGTQQQLTFALTALGLSLPLGLLARRSASPDILSPLIYVPYVWLGVLFLTTALLLAVDVARLGQTVLGYLLAWVTPRAAVDPARRQTLLQLIGGGVALASALLTARALYNGTGRVQIRRVEVPLKRLPAALDGTTIVQLSDVHVGPTIGRSFVEAIVHQANQLGADLVAITGDLVDGSVEQLLPLVAPLAALKSTHGTFFVTGNHEYYSGAAEWCEALEGLGIKVLRNESVRLGSTDAAWYLAGVDDFAAHAPGHGQDIPRAVGQCQGDCPVVLLAHQPRAAHEASRHGVDLQLSGHTHGGQLFPFRFLVGLVQPIVAGLGKIGDTLVYVSRGTGYWGPPMRLGAPAEITQIVLRSVA